MPRVVVGDRYQIVRRVGSGGMARVYLAWDTRLRLWCALKVMRSRSVADPVLRTRFAQEARVLAQLAHPNLLRLFDLVDDVEAPYMAMEFLEGGTIARRLAHGPLGVRQACDLVANVCSALGVVHAAGIVHRDLKPQNLLMDRHGVVKVADFGVARALSTNRLTMSNMSLGTLAYMPPEQQRDAARVDARADLYALGATLYALLTARRPTALTTADRSLALNELDLRVRPIVQRAIEPDPGARFQTAAAFEEALRTLLRQVPSGETEPLLVADPALVPTAPPSATGGDSGTFEPDEFDGTARPWGDAPTVKRPPPVQPPSMVRTMLLDLDGTTETSAPATPPPPTGGPPEEPTVRLGPVHAPAQGGAGGLLLGIGVGVVLLVLVGVVLGCSGVCGGVVASF